MYIDFNYQDQGTGQVRKLVCECGEEIESEQGRHITHRDRITCPHCGLTLEYDWKGFEIKKIGYPEGKDT